MPDEQLVEFLELTGQSDSVELKVTVPESEHYGVARSLGFDVLDAQIRQLFFFDTPDLALSDAGLVLRARRIQRRPGDVIVKLRPAVPASFGKALRRNQGFKVEVDAMPGGFTCSASLRERIDNSDVRQVVLGKRALETLFSKEQRRLMSHHMPEELNLGEVAVLGPIIVLKGKFDPEGLGRRMVAELWLYPDGSRVLELSTKCAPGEAFQVAAEARAFLHERGVDLEGEQQAKTAKALEFFAASLHG
ncbi:MAG: hypothetical protein JW895_15635 [Thermoleophilaceae bacterium]|nr:hypothetical protein [Thermoleophilaceae bacterium]